MLIEWELKARKLTVKENKFASFFSQIKMTRIGKGNREIEMMNVKIELRKMLDKST